MRLKEIKLLPTEWNLDVWVRGISENVDSQFNKRYGTSERSDNYINYVTHIHSSKTSALKGHTRIVMVLDKLNDAIIFHEIIHVLWRMEELIKLEMKHDSQEWQACMAEYIFNEIKKKNWLLIK